MTFRTTLFSAYVSSGLIVIISSTILTSKAKTEPRQKLINGSYIAEKEYRSCGALCDISHPTFYISLIITIYVFSRMIYGAGTPASTLDIPSAIRREKENPEKDSPFTWPQPRTRNAARSWLVFFLVLGIVEIWESYCILCMVWSVCWDYWTWSIPGAPWWMSFMKYAGMLQLVTVFGVVVVGCGVLLCFKVAAVDRLRVWMREWEGMKK